MAFNFNWSPLTADAEFYTRAQDLLTTALNKSPKPPIIVDDILVNELNLGHVPPELEILEIGDLAEDRFRGIFKMSYHGDAFLTLKTRVQANPLNTYLLTRSSFTSPRPLAAQTGLTIPIQITLSDIQLSAFIILVFSRQKGLTLVFRNDPLESLKVSSTFDSIPFVANYLQKEIEGQLRTLLMDELPAIIHRLSLQLFVPEYMDPVQDTTTSRTIAKEEQIVDPFASPPQDPVDSSGNALNPAEVASLSLDSSIETQSLFSQKNLLRLATLENSHRTLSLFTPSIRDVVFRAWTGPLERGEIPGHTSVTHTPALSRSHSYTGSLSTSYTLDSGPQIRPSLHSYGSTGHSLVMSTGRSSNIHAKRKRKKRVVDLRRQPTMGESETVIEDGSTITDSASVTESTGSAPSALPLSSGATSAGIHGANRPLTPPISPVTLRSNKFTDRTSAMASVPLEEESKPTPSEQENPLEQSLQDDIDRTIRRSKNRTFPMSDSGDVEATPRASIYLPERSHTSYEVTRPVSSEKLSNASGSSLPNFFQFITDPKNGDSIAEKAWMMKMANEIAQRYEEERAKGSFSKRSSGDSEPPPPAYALE